MTTAKKIRLGVILLILGLTATIILQNTGIVTTKILFASTEMPLAFLLFLTFATGSLAGFSLAYFRINKRITKVQKSLEKR